MYSIFRGAGVPGRRLSQSTNTLVNSPETQSLNHDEREIAPDEVVLIDATKGSKLVTSPDVIQKWLSDTEHLRSPCSGYMDD